MDTRCLKPRTVNAILPPSRFAFFFLNSSSSFRPLFIAGSRKKLNLSINPSVSYYHPLCSTQAEASGRGNVIPMPSSSHSGTAKAAGATSPNKLLQVVLVSPLIPGNTGSIARTCAASAVGLHLVEPLGFRIDDTKLKRAGLDYWPHVVVKVHSSWTQFRDYFLSQDGEKRLLAFTKRGATVHSEFTYKRGDFLVFGSETSGLPAEALCDCQNEVYGGDALRIPMVDTYVRCLNLSVSVGVAVYEASRQLNYEQLQFTPETHLTDGNSFIKEDIFA
ncbi:hypothetical protein Dimus_023357 [Dionaea muscipula]